MSSSWSVPAVWRAPARLATPSAALLGCAAAPPLESVRALGRRLAVGPECGADAARRAHGRAGGGRVGLGGPERGPGADADRREQRAASGGGGPRPLRLGPLHPVGPEAWRAPRRPRVRRAEGPGLLAGQPRADGGAQPQGAR